MTAGFEGNHVHVIRTCQGSSPVIHIACPSCKVSLRVQPERAGATLACPKCKAPVKVPSASGEAVKEKETPTSSRQRTSAIPPEEAEESEKKPTGGWGSLSATAKTGIIGGGIGVLLLCFCSGLAGLLISKSNDTSAGKTEKEKSEVRNTPSGKPSSSPNASQAEKAAYDKGFQTGYDDMEVHVADYKKRKSELTKSGADLLLSNMTAKLKEWEKHHRDLVETLTARGELSTTARVLRR